MNLFSRLLMVAMLALAFALGYLASQGGSAGQRERGVGSQRGVRTGSEGAAGENGNRKVLGGGSFQEVKERVRKHWEASPAVTVDFELLEETRRLLEKTPVADLEAWLRELRSSDDLSGIPHQLREMILKVLAPRGAGPLIRSLAEHPAEGRGRDVEKAMHYWTKQDPAAVLAWLDGDVPQEIKEELDYRRGGALEELAGKDPAEFERRLAEVDPDIRESVLEGYAYRRAAAGDRSGILERATRSPHGEAMALWEGLLRREGSDDPERALATLAELEISATDRAALDQNLVTVIARGIFRNEEDCTGLMQGWVERNPGLLVPKSVLDTLEHWTYGDPEGVVHWVAGQPPGPQYDYFARSMIGPRLGSALDYQTAARIASRIGDPLVRTDAQEKLKKIWQEDDAAAADAWEKTLSIEDQQRLQLRPANR